MTVEVRFYTDPACTWSWGAEPALRRMLWDFEGELSFTWVMGGLARRFGSGYRDEEGAVGSGPDCFADLMAHWLDVADATSMPIDPRIWRQNPLTSTYPACQAVCAASEQGWEAGYRYLRRLREGIAFGRRRLDHAEALVAEAGAARLDRDRFEIDLNSNASIEAFAADLEEVRNPPQAARDAGAVRLTEGFERASFPSAVFIGADGGHHGAWGKRDYDSWREAAVAAGATPRGGDPPGPIEVVERFGRAATREIEELTQRPRPVVEAELWTLARKRRLKPVPALTGTLWELP